MDNPNTPNSTNNPPFQPSSDVGSFPPSPTAPPPTSEPTPSWPSDLTSASTSIPTPPTSTWTPAGQNNPLTPPTVEPSPTPSNPLPATPDQTPTWTPPDQTIPQPEPTIPPMPEPTPPPSGAGPTPTFTPPPSIPPTSDTGQATGSPLDNPWGAPSQPPSLDQPPPTTQPSWTNVPTEAAPTDLSHLISNNQPEQATPPVSETLVAPSATPAPEVPNLSTETHKGMPKWLIGLGVGLLVLVVGASAYFILGIGQPTKTTSLPATTTPKTTEVKPPPPIVTPSAQPAATESANFGQLGGSSSGSQATSAADLLRQRQQGR